MMFLKPTISRFSTGLFGAMTLLMLGAIALPVFDDLQARKQATETVEGTSVARFVLTGLHNVRMERGVINAALNAKTEASSLLLALINGYDREQDIALELVVKECHKFPCIADPDQMVKLQKAIEAQRRSRPEVLRDLLKPLPDRRASIRDQFAKQAAEMISDLELINISLSANVEPTDTQTASLIEIKELSWLARAGFGLARAEVSLALAQGYNSYERDEAYHRYLGQGDGTWSVVQKLIAKPLIASDLKKIAFKAEEELQRLRQLCNGVHDDLEAGRLPRINIDEMSEASSKHLEALSLIAAKATALAHQSAQDRRKEIDLNVAFRLVALGLVCLLSIIGLIGVQRLLIRPMQSITRAMAALAAGDERVTIVGTARADEFGALAKAFDVFRTSIGRQKALEHENATTKERLMDEKRRALAEVSQSFEATISNLVGTLTIAVVDLEATANAMSSTAEQSRRRSVFAMTAAASTAENVANASQATHDLSSFSEDIGARIEQTATIAAQAVADAQRGRDTIEQLVAEANEIGGVVTLINEIANRTNLLALNATIEAGRGGEAGRGFAVVATEVKELALQTIHATSQVRTRIDGMQNATKGAAVAISSITTVINEVHTIAKAIAVAAAQQREVTRNIAAEMAEVMHGANVLSEETTQARETADITGASASRVLASASELSACSSHLDREATAFLAHLRAA